MARTTLVRCKRLRRSVCRYLVDHAVVSGSTIEEEPVHSWRGPAGVRGEQGAAPTGLKWAIWRRNRKSGGE